MEVTRFSDIAIGADLPSSAVYHLEFLAKVDNHPGLYQGPVLQRAVWRYGELWLPLAADHPDETLSAPLDIEWVWHCHLLSPVRYEDDCQRNYDQVIKHEVRSSHAYDACLAVAEHYWKLKYPNEPFQIDLDGGDLSQGHQRSRSFTFSYDLESAAARQRMFFYQVSLPHYLDGKFLDNAFQRYRKFLFLKFKNPNRFLVPCYDIDLMWHTHMNFSTSYRTDTELLLGRVFNHDDSVNDRSQGSKLVSADAVTRKLWWSTFNEHFASYGGMWRGDPPAGKLRAVTVEDLFKIASKYTEINFDRVEVQGHAKESLAKFKLHIKEKDELIMPSYYRGETEVVDISEKLITLKGPQLRWENAGNVKKYLQCLKSNNLYVYVTKNQSQTLLCCSNGNHDFGEGHIDVDSVAAKFVYVKHKISKQFEIELDTDLSVAIDMTLTLTKLGHCELWLVPGCYEECVMPEQIEQLWGPVPLPRLPPEVPNTCSVASHRLKNYKGQVEFTCRVVHSLPLLMSSVQVFFHDKMVAVAHVIGSDQIPKPDNVEDLQKCVTLDPKKGERAVIIKNSQGDWGILIGRWDGYKTGVPARRGTRLQPGRPGIPGRSGYLTVLFYKVKSKTWDLLSLEDPYATEEFRFTLGDAKVDLKIGKISVRAERNEIAEHLALTFCVSLLHVFLQPRPTNWEPGQSLEPQVSKRGARPVRYVKADKLALILAAGLLIATPSNHFIRKRMKERSSRFGAGSTTGDHGRSDTSGADRQGGVIGYSGALFGGQRNEENQARPGDIFNNFSGERNGDTGNTGNETLNNNLDGEGDGHLEGPLHTETDNFNENHTETDNYNENQSENENNEDNHTETENFNENQPETDIFNEIQSETDNVDENHIETDNFNENHSETDNYDNGYNDMYDDLVGGGEGEDNVGEPLTTETDNYDDNIFETDNYNDNYNEMYDNFGGGEEDNDGGPFHTETDNYNDNYNDMYGDLGGGEQDNFAEPFITETDNYHDNYNDLYSDLGGGDVYGEDFNTFMGDTDFGTSANGFSEGGGGDGGWSFGYNNGDAGGCGGCGAACGGGGGGIFGDSGVGGGGGDAGFGGTFSGGAFDSGDDGAGGDGGGGGGGGWMEGFSSMDIGGGGDGGGFGDSGGGGGGGDGGGCGGCGGGCGG